MQVLILGCGYVGTAFGSQMLAQGAKVSGTCRTKAAADTLSSHNIRPVIYNGTSDELMCAAAAQADVILASIPPGDKGDASFLAVRDILANANTHWIGYLSTTGVYGDRGGGWVFEDDVVTPASREAIRRVDAEQAWRSLPRPAQVFRLPGIYGPSRSALEQVKAGSARRIDKPGQVFSRAHREDIVAALLASIAKPNPGRNYNVCDDRPCASGEVIVHACSLLGVAPPALVPFADAGLSEMGQRFYSECKRVSNARAKAELGWRPRFPTYVEGLADCLINMSIN